MISKHKCMEEFLYEFSKHKTFNAEWSFLEINVWLFTMSNRIIGILAHVFLFIVIFEICFNNNNRIRLQFFTN